MKTLDSSSTFEIISGTTYIKKAAIREVDAGVIIAGEIKVAISLGVSFGGSFRVGSGDNKVFADSNGTVFSDDSGSNPNVQIASYAGGDAGVMFRQGATVRCFLQHNGTKLTFDLGSSSTMGTIQGCNDVNSQILKALSSSNPETTSAPLYSAGGGWIAGTLDVVGALRIHDRIKKDSSDGWTPGLYDGDNVISFKWDGTGLKAKVDATDLGYITIT